MDTQAFYEGRAFDAYRHLGCHLTMDGTVFRVYAPAAEAVSLIGEFSAWRELPMRRIWDGRFWECIVDRAMPGMLYKYRVHRADGGTTDHCDPYGFGMELRPNAASVVRVLSAYRFHDDAWMASRTDGRAKPVNIYEVHAGSWMRHTYDGNRWYTYEELADRLIPYVLEQGFNYIELMPLGEHPLDESWGYQVTCPYSPTSRYGTMDQLKSLVDRCHQAGIGVLLDVVYAHFARDEYALAEFDGTALYEYGRDGADESEWGSRYFNHARGEVRSYLQSNAAYWLREYHFDGLRMDAVRSLLYRKGDPDRGENAQGIDFLKTMNRGLKARHPTAMLVAEDSTTYPGVTRPVEAGGLGFDYKWDMGWTHDTLAFLAEKPSERSGDYDSIPFSMHYFYDERFLLPLSHDEVGRGKGGIAGRIWGDYIQRFRQARLLYAYMMTHPGKKLNFMGNEIAQLRAWEEGREQDWNLRAFPLHEAFLRCARALNRLYLEHPALFALDDERSGFEWIACWQRESCVYAYMRSDGRRRAAVFLNFSDREQTCAMGEERASSLKLLLDTDDEAYGGGGAAPVRLEPNHGQFIIPLPAFTARIYEAEPR